MLKERYGGQAQEIYGYDSIDEMVTDITQKGVNWLTLKDSTIIRMDRILFPLIYGDVFYLNRHQTLISTQKAFYVIANHGNSEAIVKHKSIFKFADEYGDFLVYWVKDLRKLKDYLESNK